MASPPTQQDLEEQNRRRSLTAPEVAWGEYTAQNSVATSSRLPYPVYPQDAPPAPVPPPRPWGASGRLQSETSLPLRQQIARKPINRSSFSESSSATIRPTSAISFASSSIPPSSVTPSSRLTYTGELLNEASRSLTVLATPTASPAENGQDPPPYTPPEEGSPVDVKRRISIASSRLSYIPDDVFTMIRQNRPEAVQKLLEHGGTSIIDEPEPGTGKTPIMEAASLRRVHICRVLLQSGCRLHLKDLEQNTALHWAASSGDAEICLLLIEAGAQLDEHNREGKTPLEQAARAGHTEAVECLLNCWVTQGGHSTTLMNGFMDASKSGNISTARAFINQGVKPAKMKESWKLIANAAESGSQPMLDFLVSQKCNVKERSPAGWTALHHAALKGETAMVEKLLAWKVSWKGQTKKDGETALHLATRAGHTATAMALINHKDASISVKDTDAQTPLHYAARANNMEVVAALLAKGAKLDEMTDYGWQVIHIAAAYGHTVLVADLITRGDNIEAKLGWPDFKPAKKTHEAAKKGYWCEVRWPHPGARPLHLAIEFGHDDVAHILMANGATVDQGDSKNWTPLHYAAFNGRRMILEHLLGRGVSPHSTTSEGRNPMGLGFRDPGLTVSVAEKEQIRDILNAAMHARKKSKLQSLSNFMSSGSYTSREAAERNRIWHTAELAGALNQIDEPEGEGEDEAQWTPTTSSVQQEEFGDGLFRAGTSQTTK